MSLYKQPKTPKDFNFDSAVCSLTLRCDAHRKAWLPGVQHTAELDYAVGCTLRSFLRKLVPLTPRYDAHHRARLRGGMHTAESDWFENVSFLYFRLSTPFFRKTSEVKKIPWTICDLQYQFHINIFRHHREIAFVKLQIKTDTWQVIDSPVWSTPKSCGGMYTAEFLKNCSSLCIPLRSF